LDHDALEPILDSERQDMAQNHHRRLVAEKSFLEWQAKERLSRAASSKHRRILDFSAGDMVYIWRKQLTGVDAQQNKIGQGRFVGPARILATEQKRDSQGHLIPGSSVWLVRGRRLLKCCPEQLRHASEREKILTELHDQHQVPQWDFPKVAQELGGNEYEDITGVPTLGEWKRARDPASEWQPTIRLNKKSCAPTPEVPARGSDDLVSAPGDPLPQDHGPGEHRARSRSRGREPSEPMSHGFAKAPHWSGKVDETFFVDSNPQQEFRNSVFSVEIDMPQTRSSSERAFKDLQAYFTTAMRKRAVEISERRLTPAEKQQFDQAKAIEVNNFISARAFEALAPEHKFSRADVINMRWILTWKMKPDGSKKAKARAVLQGYMDPEYEHRATHSPTTTRLSRQLQLQISASKGFRTKKGDVTGAFLQSREYPEELLCVPCDEICQAMGLAPGSVTKVKKACYGLVDAPLEWYRSISNYFTSLGLKKCWSDPCCWTLVHEGRLRGIITGHVDDFLFSGADDDPIWQSILQKIQEQYKWGEWESGKFVQCGVLVQQHDNGTYTLSQEKYAEELQHINVRASRRRDKHAPTDSLEKTQLRALLGGISWHAQQVAPHFAADVSLMLSEVNTSTVETLLRANQLLDQVKNMKDTSLVIHNIPISELILVAWADAASINRHDGGSTQGIFIGATSKEILEGRCSPVSAIAWHSSKIGRVCTSPGSSEAIAATNAEDLLFFSRFQLAEMLGYHVNIREPNSTVNKIVGCLVTDSRNVYDKLATEVVVAKGAEKRVDVTLMRLKESQNVNQVLVRWVHSDAQLANGLTKARELRQLLLYYNMGQHWKIVEDPTMSSARKRKEKGQQPLEDAENSTFSRDQPCEGPG